MADLLLADPTAFATHSAKKIGKLIEVSETTIIRFCRAIGYQSFTTLQAELRASIFDFNRQSPLGDGERKYPQFYHTMVGDLDYIKVAAQNLNYEDIDRTIEKLHEADMVLVSGTHASFSMAHWFSFSLNIIKGNTVLFRPEFDLYLDNMTNQSVVVVFSFYRYAKETLWVAETAKNQGAFIIAVTDSPHSPVAGIADIVHDLKMPNKLIYQTAPIVFSFLNAILNRYTQLYADAAELREKFYTRKGVHQFIAP